MIRTDHGKSLWSYARAVFYRLAEVVHFSVSYLGIAVLVTGVLAISVPPLKDQLRHAHMAIVTALKPDGFRFPLNYARADTDGAMTPDPFMAISPTMASDELTWADSVVQDNQDVSAGGRVQLPHLNFTRALADSEGQAAIPGVTAAQSQALRSYIARKYRIAGNVAGAIIKTAFAVGRDMGLDPQLLLAVIAIESRYNPYAESHMGAQGLMQVMTKVHEEKFAAFGEGAMAAVHPLANIQVGAQILSDCITRRGSLDGGLACYVGATGPSDGGYGAKVKAERRRIALASGIPING